MFPGWGLEKASEEGPWWSTQQRPRAVGEGEYGTPGSPTEYISVVKKNKD
jgi:hypothetical protein